MDLIASVAPIGLAIVRLCNFINAELWGRPTKLPWGVIFPHAGFIARHPSQIYECFLEGIILFILLQMAIFKYKAFKQPKLISALFLIGYGLFRIFSEYFREPDPAPTWFSALINPQNFTYGMFLSLPMILLGFYLLYSSFNSKYNAQS